MWRRMEINGQLGEGFVIYIGLNRTIRDIQLSQQPRCLVFVLRGHCVYHTACCLHHTSTRSEVVQGTTTMA